VHEKVVNLRSPATGGIFIDFVDDDTTCPERSNSSPSNAAFDKAKRHWQGFGEYYNLELDDSPSHSSASGGPSPTDKECDRTRFISVGEGIADIRSPDADRDAKAGNTGLARPPPTSALECPARPLASQNPAAAQPPPNSALAALALAGAPLGTLLFPDDGEASPEPEFNGHEEILAPHATATQALVTPSTRMSQASPNLPVVHEEEREDE
jgi:hypothetical protein